MLVDPVAGIDDRDAQGFGHGVDRFSVAVAQHHAIAVVVEHVRHIHQRFAFGDTGGAAVGDVDRIPAQAVPGAVERQARARARFVEGVDQDLPLEGCVMGDVAIGIALELCR